MVGQNIFAEDWRNCLRAHYIYIIRSGDTLTEKSLYDVMAQAGFSEAEIHQIHLEATMHIDDSGADYVPDESVAEYFAAVGEPTPEVSTEESLETPSTSLPETISEIVEQGMDDLPSESEALAESTENLTVETSEADLEVVSEDEDSSHEDEPPGLTQLSLF